MGRHAAVAAIHPQVPPATCLVVTLSRLKTLVVAMWRTSAASAFIVVTGGLVPDVVGDGIGPVGEPSDGLGQRQGGPVCVGEVRRLAPCRHGEEPLVGLARFFCGNRTRVHTGAAAVDLADPQMHESEGRRRCPALLGGSEQGLDGLPSSG